MINVRRGWFIALASLICFAVAIFVAVALLGDLSDVKDRTLNARSGLKHGSPVASDANLAVTVTMSYSPVHPALGVSYLHILSDNPKNSVKRMTGGLRTSPLVPDGTGGFWFSEMTGEGHVGETVSLWNNSQEYDNPYYGVFDSETSQYQSFKNVGFGDVFYQFPATTVREPGGREESEGQQTPSPERFLSSVTMCGGKTIAFAESSSRTPHYRIPIEIYSRDGMAGEFTLATTWHGDTSGAGHIDSWAEPVCLDGKLYKPIAELGDAHEVISHRIMSYDPHTREVQTVLLDSSEIDPEILESVDYGPTFSISDGVAMWLDEDSQLFSAPLTGGRVTPVLLDLPGKSSDDSVCRLTSEYLACVYIEDDNVHYQLRSLAQDLAVTEQRTVPELKYVVDAPGHALRFSSVLPLSSN